MDVGMQQLTGFVINRALKRVFLLHKTELLQLVQNKNKVTLVVHQLKMTSLSEARRLLHIRLTVTEGLNSKALFPPEKCLFWEHQEWPGCRLNIAVKICC